MSDNGDPIDKLGNTIESDSEGDNGHEIHDDGQDSELDAPKKPLKSALKSTQKAEAEQQERPPLPDQTEPKDLDVSTLSPLTPEIIARQATINIGTIGHVAHGKSTVVKAISGVQTVCCDSYSRWTCTLVPGADEAVLVRSDSRTSSFEISQSSLGMPMPRSTR